MTMKRILNLIKMVPDRKLSIFIYDETEIEIDATIKKLSAIENNVNIFHFTDLKELLFQLNIRKSEGESQFDLGIINHNIHGNEVELLLSLIKSQYPTIKIILNSTIEYNLDYIRSAINIDKICDKGDNNLSCAVKEVMNTQFLPV